MGLVVLSTIAGGLTPRFDSWLDRGMENDYDLIDYDDPDYGWEDDAYQAQWDDDPNPYHGDYSEM